MGTSESQRDYSRTHPHIPRRVGGTPVGVFRVLSHGPCQDVRDVVPGGPPTPRGSSGSQTVRPATTLRRVSVTGGDDPRDSGEPRVPSGVSNDSVPNPERGGVPRGGTVVPTTRVHDPFRTILRTPRPHRGLQPEVTVLTTPVCDHRVTGLVVLGPRLLAVFDVTGGPPPLPYTHSRTD